MQVAASHKRKLKGSITWQGVKYFSAAIFCQMLKDEALPELQRIITEHQSDESPPSGTASLPISVTSPPINSLDAGDQNSQTRGWLARRSPSEFLNHIGWTANTENFLLMAAFHEAPGGAGGWRKEDMETRFLEARETFPGNFGRDISMAIKGGIITSVTPRTYAVSRTGWNKITDAIAAIPIG